jgi:hypothetical protein
MLALAHKHPAQPQYRGSGSAKVLADLGDHISHPGWGVGFPGEGETGNPHTSSFTRHGMASFESLQESATAPDNAGSSGRRCPARRYRRP